MRKLLFILIILSGTVGIRGQNKPSVNGKFEGMAALNYSSDIRGELGIGYELCIIKNESKLTRFSSYFTLSKSLIPDLPGISPRIGIGYQQDKMILRMNCIQYKTEQFTSIDFLPEIGVALNDNILLVYGFFVPIVYTSQIEKNHSLTLIFKR